MWLSVNKNDNNRYLLPCHSIDFNFYFTTTISIHKCEWKYDKDDDHYYFDDNDSNDNNYYNNFNYNNNDNDYNSTSLIITTIIWFPILPMKLELTIISQNSPELFY